MRKLGLGVALAALLMAAPAAAYPGQANDVAARLGKCQGRLSAIIVIAEHYQWAPLPLPMDSFVEDVTSTSNGVVATMSMVVQGVQMTAKMPAISVDMAAFVDTYVSGTVTGRDVIRDMARRGTLKYRHISESIADCGIAIKQANALLKDMTNMVREIRKAQE